MEVSCQGMRIIITAGGAGLGWAMAKTFLNDGAKVHICDIVEERLTACRAEFPQLGTSLTDVSDPQQVEQLFAEATTHLGGLDVLINNAGISGPTGTIDQLNPQDWEQTIAVNLNGQFYCARLAVPLLKAAGGGSIVNLSSTAGIMGYPLRTPYAASKWAVVGLSKSMAMELGQFKIRVNALCPGPVDSPRMDAVIAAEAKAMNLSEDTIRRAYYRQTSLRTFIDPQDIANMVLYLCSEAGSKISGQAVTVDGHSETLRL